MSENTMNTKKLRIAMLGHKVIPSRMGGIEVVVEELATRMARLGHEVTCYNRMEEHVSEQGENGFPLRKYKGVRLKYVFTLDKRGLAAMTSSISATLRAAFGKYDVVHIHAEGPAFICWLPRLMGKKVVVTVHGLDHQRAKWGRLASRYIMMGERSAVKYADEIIVLSHGLQDYFKETYGRETTFITNGVNEPIIRDDHEIRKAFGLEKDSYFLYLGRLVPEKGLTYLIQAFKGLHTDKKLVIAGGSSDSRAFTKKLKEQAKGDPRILFTDFVQGEVLEELYSNAYVYVLPSDLEGMPISLLEAMSYGNCCVTSDIAECTEVVEDKAVTFHKSCVRDLRAKLQKLADNPRLVDKYKKEARSFVLSRYNWDRVTEQTLELYQKDKA